MDLNKLYEKCKNELEDRTLRNIQEEEELNWLKDKILCKRIKFHFLDKFLNKKIYERSTFGGDWLLYEWNRYLDEVVADEKMQTFPRLDENVNNLRKYERYDISTTQLIDTLMLEVMADMWNYGHHYDRQDEYVWI